ncbi:unnamed protein product [Gordionus sp. m RMFG-2023]|uniref:polyglutamine-binding protein 1-like n=1 Tax=Gordionus sp. m RMFG-2023 TaxID=3053472 RepID=UPI0030E42BFA
MPLPPTLLARLAKRGILNKDVKQSEEEVIAENYDDDSSTNHLYIDGLVVLGCPNRWNPFHKCCSFCQKHWGNGKEEDDENKKRRMAMLTIYPLPKEWKEIYDPLTGRFYYWNITNDRVSWLSPNHPRAKITISVTKLFKDAIARSKTNIQTIEIKRKREKETLEREKETKLNNKEKTTTPLSYFNSKSNSSIKKTKSELDPMDPASYSDIPRGTWTSGLDAKDEAATGVDQTVPGPLFQMRPYPSPGAILKANQSQKSSNKDKNKKGKRDKRKK